nr:hypothetical protein [Tanacetum cinerariifolium]
TDSADSTARNRVANPTVTDYSGRVGEPHGYRDSIHVVDRGAPYRFGEEAPRTVSGTPVVFLFFLPC